MADSKLCKIEGCGKGAHRRGWCPAHYSRWYRHGDPLGGGTATGEPHRFLNEVVLPYDGDECLIWPYNRSSGGYPYIWVDQAGLLVTRIVCESENGPAPSATHQAAHSCGNGSAGCVTKKHLTWKTPIENTGDQVHHGTRLRGHLIHNAKLTAKDVHDIRASSLANAELGRKYGVSAATITRAKSGDCWGWLD